MQQINKATGMINKLEVNKKYQDSNDQEQIQEELDADDEEGQEISQSGVKKRQAWGKKSEMNDLNKASVSALYYLSYL